MITRVTNGLYKSIYAFITAYYSSGNDSLANAPIYTNPTPEFEPDNLESYQKLLSSANFSVVIHNPELSNRDDHPVGFVNFIYEADVTFVRKSANAWDVTNRRNRVVRGNSSAPYMNSLGDLVMNFQAYTQKNKWDDGSGVVTFWQRLERIQAPKQVGDFISITGSMRAMGQYSTTLSITPV